MPAAVVGATTCGASLGGRGCWAALRRHAVRRSGARLRLHAACFIGSGVGRNAGADAGLRRG